MLEAKGVHFGYRAGREVLCGVSASFGVGVCAVAGPNGAGKSTLLRVLLGVLEPGRGQVELDGRCVHEMGARERARRVAYIAQRPSVASRVTVREYVGLGGYARGGVSWGEVDGAIEQMALGPMAEALFAELSVGQQQRAGVARALAQLGGEVEGSVLLADEPCSAMDPKHALLTMRVLGELGRAGVAVVVVLHDLLMAQRAADRAVLMGCDGAVVAAGPTEQVLTAERLSEVFGTRFEVATLGRAECGEGAKGGEGGVVVLGYDRP